MSVHNADCLGHTVTNQSVLRIDVTMVGLRNDSKGDNLYSTRTRRRHTVMETAVHNLSHMKHSVDAGCVTDGVEL